MVRFVTAIVGGLTLGGIISIAGLGLVLVYRATHTFNFAHGQMLVLSAFTVGYLQTRDVPLAIGLPVALALGAGVGVAFYLLVLRRMAGQPLFMGIMATLGLAAVLEGLIGILFRPGRYDITVPGLPEGSVELFGARVSQASLVIFALTLSISVSVVAALRYTHVGLRIRAAGQDAVLASQCGLQVRRLHAGSWAIAAILAAVAGTSYGATAGVNKSLVVLGLAALPAMMLGGLDSIGGCVVGGFTIGVLQQMTQTYLGGEYVDLVTYSLLLAVVLLYPQGLFGSKNVVRA